MAVLLKRGSRWYIRWWADGKEHKRSLGPDVQTEAQAKRWLREFEKANAKGQIIPMDPSQVTLQKLRDEYLQARQGHIDPKSIKRYQTALDALIKGVGRKARLVHLTTRKLAQWATRRREEGVTAAGVNADLRHIKAVLRRAEEWGYLERAPKVEMLRTGRRLPRHYTNEQVEEILSKEEHPDRRRLWVFMLWTGLRRWEACNLAWENIQWKPYPVARIIGKRDKERAVPILPPALEALGEPREEGPVFVFSIHPGGSSEREELRQVHPDTITHWWAKIAAAAGQPTELHRLRHTFSTYAMTNGISPRLVRDIMGHDSIVTTEGYSVALVGEHYEELANALSQGRAPLTRCITTVPKPYQEKN